MKRTLPPSFRRRMFLWDNIGLPGMLAVPSLVILLFVLPRAAPLLIAAGLSVGALMIVWPAWRFSKFEAAAA